MSNVIELFRKPLTVVPLHEPKGVHLLLTLSGCDPEILNDADAMLDLTREAAEATGATVLQIAAQRFEPQGITAFAVLAESHASIHTYPESNTVFWDCFTCGITCDPHQSIAVLVDALKPSIVDKQEIQRGK